VRELDSTQNDFFALLLGTGFNHHNAVFVSDDHDVDGAFRTLGIGGIGYEFPVYTAYANRAHGRAERNIGER
jgi:hypothetical protein